NERPMTAIDFVLAHGSPLTSYDANRTRALTAAETAALWLCEQLHIDPRDLGYQQTREEPPPHQAVPVGPPNGSEEPPPHDKVPEGPPPQRDKLLTAPLAHTSPSPPYR